MPSLALSELIGASVIDNTGTRAGAEVVELYVHDGHSKIDRPAHELKSFQRVSDHLKT